MAETFGFYDTEKLVDGTYDREYVAQQWADYFKLFIGTGVFASPTNQLKVVAGKGMNVVVKAGWAFIEGRWYHNDADLVLPVQPNTTASTITSGVFIQANSSDRVIKAVIATGRTTPDREAPYYELELAQIQLATGTTSITDSMITDMRPDESVCGFVKGLLEGVIPTADLFIQFEAQFNTWFQKVKDQLSEDAAGHLQDEIDAIRPRTTTNLLNSTLKTMTANGVTCIANGDGTYTLNGTANGIGQNFVFRTNMDLEDRQYKWVCESTGSGYQYVDSDIVKIAKDGGARAVLGSDRGDGLTFSADPSTYRYECRIHIHPNTSITSLTFKPMLTTDLQATYDDYVQYSGDGELNENVARNSKQLTLTKDSIAPTEENSFVIDDHHQGDYFYGAKEEKLYRALVDISADDSIDEGSNVEEVTIGAELSSLFGITGRTNSQLLASDGQKFQFAKSGTKYGYKINGVFHPFEKVQASKAVTASTSTQTVTPDSGYDGIASVTVNPTPSQSKSVTATTSAQTVSPDSGKLLSSVTVNPQVHSGTRASVTSNGTIDLGATHNIRYIPVNVPSISISGAATSNVTGAASAISIPVVNGGIYALAFIGEGFGASEPQFTASKSGFTSLASTPASTMVAGDWACHQLFIGRATSSTITWAGGGDDSHGVRQIAYVRIG